VHVCGRPMKPDHLVFARRAGDRSLRSSLRMKRGNGLEPGKLLHTQLERLRKGGGGLLAEGLTKRLAKHDYPGPPLSRGQGASPP
jgi:hypothetical protein